MRYTPRRRRGDEEQHEGGGLPVIPLVIIVVFAGLLLGGLLAHFFGNRGAGARQALSPSLLTPLPTPTLIPSPTPLVRRHTPRPRPSASPTQRASPSPRPTAAKPAVKPAPAPTVTSAIAPVITPRPSVGALPESPGPLLPVVITASPRPIATATPPPLPAVRTTPRSVTVAAPRQSRGMQTDDPNEIVRAYLYALVHGNESKAASYLVAGKPAEPFMRGARIGDVESTSNGDGTYLVTADVRARSGNYRVTFTVADLPQGMVITDHFYVKAH